MIGHVLRNISASSKSADVYILKYNNVKRPR